MMYRFFSRQWFLCCLGVVLLVGMTYPDRLAWAADAIVLRNCIVASVLFFTALTLETKTIWQAIRHPAATGLAVGLNMLFVPVAAWVLSRLLSGELALGLIVTASAPCTIASAAVWTRRAGGNDAIAIMVTLVTNLCCFVVTPLCLKLLANQSQVEIDLVDMIVKLSYLVLLPMLAARAVRYAEAIATWAGDNRPLLGTLSQAGILCIVLSGAVNCGLQLRDTSAGPGLGWADWTGMLTAVVALRLISLGVGQALGHVIGLAREDWIAVGFAGSQKTLMIGLHVALMVGGGLTILPMVAYHVTQLLIDTIVADRLVAKHKPD